MRYQKFGSTLKRTRGAAALTAFVAAGAATAGSVRADLIRHYPLDGNGAEVTPSGVDAAPQGTPTAAADRSGNPAGAVSFDGVDDVLVASDGGGLNGLQTGTIALFVKWNGAAQDQACCGITAFGTILARQLNGQFSNNVIALTGPDPETANVQWRPYGHSETAAVGTTPPGDGDWHHIAVTFSSGDHDLYIDGERVGGSATTGTIDARSTELGIGAWIGDGASFSRSALDDLRIYDNVLTQSDIQALIPEPAGLGLLALGGLGLFARRRRA